jgi:hypothetical protein
MSSASRFDLRRAPSAAFTCGHHTRKAVDEETRIRGRPAAVTRTVATARPRTIQRSVRESPLGAESSGQDVGAREEGEDGDENGLQHVAGERIDRTRGHSRLPGKPWRWKKRMNTVILASAEGSARFRYDVASCST